VKVILKADSIGSLEALKYIVSNVNQAALVHGVHVKVIHQQVGDISSTDIELASSTSGNSLNSHLILAFNVHIVDQATRLLAKQLDVSVCIQNVIYRLEEQLISTIETLLPKQEMKQREGQACIQKIFHVKDHIIAGLLVTSGTLYTNNKANTIHEDCRFVYEILRQNTTRIIIPTAGEKMNVELKRFKDNVKHVDAGLECGLHVMSYGDYQEGDVVECYKVTYKVKNLELGYNKGRSEEH
jgi:translation initiation factor IF-2